MHYVMSDVHGQFGLYQMMMDYLDLQTEDRLYVLGDVIDVGPDGIAILMDLMQRSNVEFFLGDHEFEMLQYLKGYGSYWLNMGSERTLDEYELLSLKEQRNICRYLENSWVQKRVFVDHVPYMLHHGHFIPERRDDDVQYLSVKRKERIRTAVWSSPFETIAVPMEEYDDEYIHIVGHMPAAAKHGQRPPYIEGNVYCIDGGCSILSQSHTGLYCMALERDDAGNHIHYMITKKEDI